MGSLRLPTELRVQKTSNMGLIWDRSRRPTGELRYKRLSNNHTIRVIKIKSGTAKWPIRVKLKTIDMRTTKYTALSYTWETDSDDGSEVSATDVSVYSRSSAAATNTILCNGCPVRITKNLWDALEQLRDINSDQPIWIDRLCVDFDSREERAAQCNLMGAIYGKASYVVAWLGKKSKSTEDTILAIRKIVNSINWRRIPSDFQRNFHDLKLYKELGIDRVSVQQWKSIHSFCSARLFSRLWAFHEIFCAREAVFLIGDTCMDYDFVLDFAMILGLTGWIDEVSTLINEGSEESYVGFTRMLGPVAALRAIPVWHPKHADHDRWMKDTYNLDTEIERAWKFLELVMEACEEFECQDPRDRVFAPLALVRRVFEGTSVNKQWPIVDYSTSVETIYLHFSNMIEKHTRAPSILATALTQNSSRPAFTRIRSNQQRRPID